MKHYLITRMPNEPGALHKAAKIIREHHGNISRIHYDNRIDPHTTFFEIDVPDNKAFKKIIEGLHKIGYLQETLEPIGFLKFNVYLPNRPGALFEFLNYTTSANANIAFLDFDEKGKHPDRLTVALTIERSSIIEKLLNNLKSKYRIEILEYDPQAKQLDNTVFYIKFAQQLREILGSTEDKFLLKLLNDINHIVQELTNLKQDPFKVFNSIVETGKRLKETSENKFYSDIQSIKLKDDINLYCFQFPCGGNIFILNSPKDMIMIDSGFGIYHNKFVELFNELNLGNLNRLSRIFITHADADHAGGAGFFSCPSFMHKATSEAIDIANRAYGSKIENSVLEEVYTKLINLFSNFNPPKNREIFPQKVLGLKNIFPIIYTFEFSGYHFDVLESLGGHLFGQVYFLCEELGLLFTGDSLINFNSLTEDKKEFATLATILMTSVNVDSEIASKERKTLINIAEELNKNQKNTDHGCLICAGHGAISSLDPSQKLIVPKEINPIRKFLSSL